VSADLAIDLVRQALLLGLLVAGPILLVGLLVGLVLGLLQAATQISEQTLAFVPSSTASPNRKRKGIAREPKKGAKINRPSRRARTRR